MEREFEAIASMGLQSLQFEPERLSSESDKLSQQLESLVMDNYRIFVENLTCSVKLRSEDKLLANVTKDLDDELHGISQQCTAFRDRVAIFVNSHKRNRKTLQHHMQLVELLEVPQLVDACARNGFHDEALELANFVNNLEKRHLLVNEVKFGTSNNQFLRTGNSVVQSIVHDVHITLLSMRHQLLQLLAESTTLPKQISLLASLRRLDILFIDSQLSLEKHTNSLHSNIPVSPVSASLDDSSGTVFSQSSDSAGKESLRQHLIQSAETRLQMDYLEARSLWLDKLLDRALNEGLGASTALHQMGIGSSVSSEDVLEDRGSRGIIAGTGQSSNPQLQSPYGRTIEMLEVNRSAWFAIITHFYALFEENSGNVPSSMILSAWVTQNIHSLLSELESTLIKLDDGASIRSVLEQTVFFANRMAQIGSDFTPLILPIFTNSIVKKLSHDWSVVVANCKSMLSTEKFILTGDGFIKEQVVPLYMAQPKDVVEASPTPLASHSQKYNPNDEIPAPTTLLAYPPLGYLLNSILIGFNILRDVPIPALREQILECLSINLLDFTQYLIRSSPDVRTRGTKYIEKLSNSFSSLQTLPAKKKRESGFPVNQEADETAAVSHDDIRSLDIQYADSFVSHFLPHISSCFNSIFATSEELKDGQRGVLSYLQHNIQDLLFQASLLTTPPNFPSSSSTELHGEEESSKKFQKMSAVSQTDTSTLPKDVAYVV